MTYCMALKLDSGLLYMSDTRTNAGVDNVSTVSKLKSWDRADRTLTLLSAGNLATTQAVVAWLEQRNLQPDQRDPTILSAPSMFEVARIVGDTLSTEIESRSKNGQPDPGFSGTFVLGGQIEGADPRLYLIYPEGNFIEATPDNPFFQIGEAKYGKPILLRAFDQSMDWRDAVRLMLVSMDSTVRSNLSVGPPFDLRFVPAGTTAPAHERRIQADDPYFEQLAEGWSEALRTAIPTLPPYED